MRLPWSIRFMVSVEYLCANWWALLPVTRVRRLGDLISVWGWVGSGRYFPGKRIRTGMAGCHQCPPTFSPGNTRKAALLSSPSTKRKRRTLLQNDRRWSPLNWAFKTRREKEKWPLARLKWLLKADADALVLFKIPACFPWQSLDGRCQVEVSGHLSVPTELAGPLIPPQGQVGIRINESKLWISPQCRCITTSGTQWWTSAIWMSLALNGCFFMTCLLNIYCNAEPHVTWTVLRLLNVRRCFWESLKWAVIYGFSLCNWWARVSPVSLTLCCVVPPAWYGW